MDRSPSLQASLFSPLFFFREKTATQFCPGLCARPSVGVFCSALVMFASRFRALITGKWQVHSAVL